MTRSSLFACATVAVVCAACSDGGGGGNGGANPVPALFNVIAQQQLDAARLVEVHYDLALNAVPPAEVRLSISMDGGITFPVQASSVFGDIGAGQSSGTAKRIVWNPSVDLPGISGSGFVARVIANDIYHGDSPSFSLSLAAAGSIHGSVRNSASSATIAAAQVSIIGGPNTTTNSQGTYQLTNVDPGEQTLLVSASGFIAIELPVTIAGSSSQLQDVSLAPQGPAGIVEVRGKFCNPDTRTFYLDQVDLTVEFRAQVNWGSLVPGDLHWITPFETIVQDASTGVAIRNFEMGEDFGPGGTLQVLAVSRDIPPVSLPPATSRPYVVNFKVVSPPPPFIPLAGAPTPFDDILLYAIPFSSTTLKYTTPETGFFKTDIDKGVGADKIPPKVPILGGKQVKFGVSITASASVEGSGTLSAGMKVAGAFPPLNKIKIGTTELKTSVAGNMQWIYDEVLDTWVLTTGTLSLGANFTFDFPTVPYYIVVPPIPIPFYARGELEIEAALSAVINGWADGKPQLAAVALDLDPFPKVTGAFGAGLYGLASVEGYVGGGLRLKLLSPPMPPALTEAKVFIKGGIRVITFVWQHNWPLGEWACDLGGASCPPFWHLNDFSATAQPIPRDYLTHDGDYAVFTANDSQARDGAGTGTIETVVQSNVFGQSTPTLVALGPDRLAVWVYDDPSRTPTNRAELVWSYFDATSQSWSAPSAVADDGTADFHPQLATSPNGTTVLVWENVKEILVEPVDPNDPLQQEAKYDEMRAKLDIAAASFDRLTQTWSAQARLIDDSGMDSAPRIALAADGSALATWISNASSHPIGTAGEPNDILYARFDGSAWSSPAIASVNVPSVLKCALAYKGTQGMLLYSGDLDNDTSTPEDRELFAVQFLGGSWQAPVQLTHDTLEDANPQVAYDSLGSLLMAWYSGGLIVSASDVALGDRTTAVDGTGGENSGLGDFRMATDAVGRIGLVWQDASAQLVDLWYATYDPSSPSAPWSKRQRLTQDNSLTPNSAMEYAAWPTFADNGDLLVLYDKAALKEEVQFMNFAGEAVAVSVPVPGRVSLCLATHVRRGDLAVFPQDLSLSHPNPLAGEVTTISALVHNQGDVASSQIEVEFLDGSTLIGKTTIPGPLVGGDSASVDMEWIVPQSSLPHALTVVVDPKQLQQDDDWSNNTATLVSVMKPDVTIDALTLQRFGTSVQFVARVMNRGALDLVGVEVRFRRETTTGPVIGSVIVPGPIVPGAFVDVPVSWTPSGGGPMPAQQWIYAIVDESDSIDEFDEGNNTSRIRLRNPN